MQVYARILLWASQTKNMCLEMPWATKNYRMRPSHRNNWSVAEEPGLQEIPFSVIYFVTFQRLWRLRRRPKVGVFAFCARSKSHMNLMCKSDLTFLRLVNFQESFRTKTFILNIATVERHNSKTEDVSDYRFASRVERSNDGNCNTIRSFEKI